MKGYPTVFNGVIFIESNLEDFHSLGSISVDLSFKFGAQLKNLNDVKDGLSKEALALNANCITMFTYGQKSRWLAIDDVAFFGKGIAGKISDDKYSDIIEYIKNR